MYTMNNSCESYIRTKMRVFFGCCCCCCFFGDVIKVLDLYNTKPDKVKEKIPFRCLYMDFEQVSHYDLVFYCVSLLMCVYLQYLQPMCPLHTA